ncbi:MAG: RluA family pseudouridine synthase [Weeksellaceae bacterium]
MQNLDIIFENNQYIVVNKAAGLISEKNPYESNTVEDQIYNHLLNKIKHPYIGVIHRLDRVTSGVLIFAKKKNTLVKFNKLFSDRKVQKTYVAVVANKPPKDKDKLNHYLFKNNELKRADIVNEKFKDAKPASLSYEIIGENSKGYIVKIKPSTGRFHQIRAQFAHIGLPIIGDEKYGSKILYQPLAICLHASELQFKNKQSNEEINYTAPLPENEFWKF